MTTRERSFTWQDPIELAKAARVLPGQEFLKKIVAGELPPPPIGEMMNFGLDHVEDGQVVFTVEPAEYHYNPIGVVHGGVAATLLDSAMGCAVHAKLDAGTFYTSHSRGTNTGCKRAVVCTWHDHLFDSASVRFEGGILI
jgi:hypothetical protein